MFSFAIWGSLEKQNFTSGRDNQSLISSLLGTQLHHPLLGTQLHHPLHASGHSIEYTKAIQTWEVLEGIF